MNCVFHERVVELDLSYYTYFLLKIRVTTKSKNLFNFLHVYYLENALMQCVSFIAATTANGNTEEKLWRTSYTERN